ncbi:c-type cytochrome [Vineibacter terrae]|uniref:C-type cytochrome n=1 Tax=Vineibacter terrae TaxID=2586908 RepID=A0A5C8PLW2_9HYPH|nr:c-type cytochrome [Vineibacter terrae]TXL74676.1 c-type cytochrome [Vineibacter terrae]
MSRHHAAAVLLAAFALAGTGGSAAAQDAGKGKQLYAKNCLHCHGRNMVTPGTVAYDLRQFPEDDKPRFEASVTKGKKNMPPWGDKLTKEQIDDLWAYIMTRGK